MNYLYVRHGYCVCVTWFIHVCDMSRSYVRHDSFILWDVLFIRVTWFVRALMAYKSAMQNAGFRAPEMWSSRDGQKLKNTGVSGGRSNKASRCFSLYYVLVTSSLHSVLQYSHVGNHFITIRRWVLHSGNACMPCVYANPCIECVYANVYTYHDTYSLSLSLFFSPPLSLSLSLSLLRCFIHACSLSPSRSISLVYSPRPN